MPSNQGLPLPSSGHGTSILISPEGPSVSELIVVLNVEVLGALDDPLTISRV